jgi:pimeloyl-[acyl-carrier protein] methyl ester esterase
MPAVNKIVFLPGWGFLATIWDDIANRLSSGEAICLELPRLDLSTTLPEIADQLKKLIPVGSIIVGWSLGGLLGLEFCARYPDHCRRLVLTASTPKFVADENWQGITKLQQSSFIRDAIEKPDLLMTQFRSLVQYPDRSRYVKDYMSLHSIQGDLNYLEILFESDLREMYRSIKLDVDYILGEKDAIISSGNINRLKELNPRTKVEVIQGAGHIPFLTHKNEFIQCLNGILSRA